MGKFGAMGNYFARLFEKRDKKKQQQDEPVTKGEQVKDTDRDLLGTQLNVKKGNFEEKKRRLEDELGQDEDEEEDDLQFSFREKEFANRGNNNNSDDDDDILTTGKKPNRRESLVAPRTQNPGGATRVTQRRLDSDQDGSMGTDNTDEG